MNKFVQTNNIKPLAKTVSYTITKTDSITLKVDMHETFRRRAYKKYLTKEFDTTFLVKYSSAVYETIITDLNYINCDRFLKFPKVTDFYVKTPDFVGAQLLVYFKNLNAFMPAEYENDKYSVLSLQSSVNSQWLQEQTPAAAREEMLQEQTPAAAMT